MTKGKDSLDDAGVLAVLVKHADAFYRRKNEEDAITRHRERIKGYTKTIGDCEAALRIFGYDLREDGAWGRLTDRYGERVFEELERQGFVRSDKSKTDAASDAETEDAKISALPKPEMPTIQEILLERLQEIGELGSKAAPLRQYIQQSYNIEIHEKTVGMTLYRLLKKGLVRREGHVWFFVPQDAETKNPGELPPGLAKLL